MTNQSSEFRIIVGVCREDNPHDVDEAYGAGTYARLFPSDDDAGAFQCKRCHRMYAFDDSRILNGFECLRGGALIGIPLEAYEDHLHSLNEGD